MEKNFNFWITGLILLGLFFVSITGWSVLSASKGVSSVVHSEHYDQGRTYNQYEDGRSTAATMGWNAAVTVKGRRVAVRLAGANSAPVSGCRGQISLHSPHPGSKAPLHLEMQESSPGIYAALLPAGIMGGIPAELTLAKEGMVLRRNLLLNIQNES